MASFGHFFEEKKKRENKKAFADISELLSFSYVAFTEWELSTKTRIPSQNDFAQWIGIPNTSLSVWINKVRTPTGKSIHVLAEKLGPDVYDALGQPRMMPNDKRLKKLAVNWFKLDERTKKQIEEIVENNDFDQKAEGLRKNDFRAA